MCRSLLALLTLVTSSLALAAAEGPGVHQYLHAVRAEGPVTVDGKLDDPAWQRAPGFTGFVQSFPLEGVTPSERTEVRVLYTDNMLYVGVVCFDSQPELILRGLGRRDNVPSSDLVDVAIDSTHDHRTAYLFKVNAGGVQGDALLFDDTRQTTDWDAVWDAAVARRPDGWSAELAIPLALLRFPRAEVQTWGFQVHRYLARTHEDLDTVLLPRQANGRVSRYGHLTGLRDLQPQRDVELTPYLAARAVLRPQYSDPDRAQPRLLDPSGDLGLDIKAGLSSNLTLNATVNPDFGQVEADQIIQNLSNQEAFFPEKRPFFTQGMDLFTSAGAEDGNSRAPQMLFYSRRIGLDTPILGAAKVTGTVVDGVQVGLLDAVVAADGLATVDEANPDRRYRFHLVRPLHLGPEDELATAHPVPENYFVGVLRGQLSGSARVGARVSSAIPLVEGECTPEDEQLRPAPARCRPGGNAAAVDWDLRTADGKWVFYGQLAGAQTLGGPEVQRLRDGTELHRGETGWGTYLLAGKRGGEPFRFDVTYERSSPTLELNAAGFLPLQNQQTAAVTVRLVRPNGLGALHSFDANLQAYSRWSTDGRWTNRGRGLILTSSALLPGFSEVGFEGGVEDRGYDIREIGFTGIPFERPHRSGYASLWTVTDTSRPFYVDGFAAVGARWFPDGTTRAGYTADVTLVFRPTDRLETRLSTTYDYTPHGPRYVDSDPDDAERYLFGDLDSRFLSITLRQQLVITPRLTLQAYAQLFTDYGIYGQFSAGRSDGRAPILLNALEPAAWTGEDPSFRDGQLILNAVLRWEYRLGSTLFLVYTRSQTEVPLGPGEAVTPSLLPTRLFQGRATDAVLLKWSYWWN